MARRIMTTILATVMTLLAMCMAAPEVAAEEETKLLTVEDCVQISDTQIIVKFSEPIAVNLLDSNRGPWIALRIVDTGNNLQYDGAAPLQYQGATSFVGEEHDTMLFELGRGLTYTANDIINFQGDFAKYYRDGLEVDLCIEEVPYDQTKACHDGYIDNVTTLDGETRLWANAPYGWDGMYCSIRVDYSYELDTSSTESLSVIDDFDYGTILSVEEREIPEPVVETKVIKQNNPVYMIVWLVAGFVVAFILCLVTMAIVRKAGKKA